MIKKIEKITRCNIPFYQNHVNLLIHQIIIACSTKLKPATYLIKRTHISQLIHITKNEPNKSSCFTGQTAGKVVAVKKDAKYSGTIDDWKEKDVLLKSWISSTLTEESTLIVGCSTAKEMREYYQKKLYQKTINFAGNLGKESYPTLNQFVNALTGFDIRKKKKEVKKSNMVLSAKKRQVKRKQQ